MVAIQKPALVHGYGRVVSLLNNLGKVNITIVVLREPLQDEFGQRITYSSYNRIANRFLFWIECVIHFMRLGNNQPP